MNEVEKKIEGIIHTIEAWFRREIANSPASRDPAVWDHVRKSVEHLKSDVKASAKPPTTDAKAAPKAKE